MPTGYHDNSNNPTNNFVLHLSATTAGRGIPAVGKLVYRTDLGYVQTCTSTSPNPTLNGGGTWNSLGGGGIITLDGADFTFVQSDVTYLCTGGGWYTLDAAATGTIILQVDSISDPNTHYPTTIELSPITLLGWPVDCAATPLLGYGRFDGTANSVPKSGHVKILDLSGTPTGGLNGVGGDGVTGMVLAVGDIFYIDFRYPVA